MFNKEAYLKIKNEIPPSVKILAATKTQSPETIKQALEFGITLIGENYVQEAKNKYQELENLLKEKNIQFHLIGHLQSGKVNTAIRIFDCIQTVDSINLANKINNACKKINKKIEIFIEVNFESQKSGIKIDELDNLINEIKKMSNLNLRGLMAIPPIDKEKYYFKILKELTEKYQFPELSLGMSGDYQKAINQGSTLIRLGTVLFGTRS